MSTKERGGKPNKTLSLNEASFATKVHPKMEMTCIFCKVIIHSLFIKGIQHKASSALCCSHHVNTSIKKSYQTIDENTQKPHWQEGETHVLSKGLHKVLPSL
jgi:hypothetical protein